MFNKDGSLFYKGTFKYGRKNGPGKAYWDNGILLTEGTYKNNKQHGFGTQYSPHGFLVYKGEYIYDRQKIGKGYIPYDFDNTEEFYYIIDYNEKLDTIKNYNCIVSLDYIGSWQDYEHEFGKEYHPNGKCSYEGNCYDGTNKSRFGINYNQYGEIVEIGYNN